MLTPLPLGLGLRYLWASQHQYFVSFISVVSLAGIGLGAAALIAILSVMNGFEGELRTRLLSLAAHATLPGSPEAASLRTLAERARSEPGVASAEPFVEVQGLLSHNATLAGVVLRGIDARDHGPDTALAKAMIAGEVGQLIPGSTRVALGRVLAYQLEAQPGDHVSLLLLRSNADGSLAPRIGSFEVSGEFEVGLADHDSTLAFASLETSQRSQVRLLRPACGCSTRTLSKRPPARRAWRRRSASGMRRTGRRSIRRTSARFASRSS
jgi:lipoprotein-releasing system permease protein